MEKLSKRVRERLTTAKAFTVFESELDRVWPREKIHREKRELAIQIFAKNNGWTAKVVDGIRVTFRKADAA